MPFMTLYNFGDVVLVSFPFTNLQTTKKRPAVIISRQNYQQNRPDVILMAITSQVQQPLAANETLLHDWQKAGLVKPSVLKPLIATIEKNRIIKIIGKLSTADRKNVNKIIQAILGE